MFNLYSDIQFKHIVLLSILSYLSLAILFFATMQLLDPFHLYLTEMFFMLIVFCFMLFVAYRLFDNLETKYKELDSSLNLKSQQLLTQNHYLAKVLDNTPNIILLIKDNVVIDANKTFYEYIPHENGNKKINFCEFLESENSYLDCKEKKDFHKSFAMGNTKIKLVKGLQERYFSAKVELLDKEQNEYIAILSDITDVESQMRSYEQIATTDTLTQVANRFQFEILFDQEIKNSKRYKLDLSLIFLDLDGFKGINDTYGHSIGDKALVQVTQIIKNNIRSSDIFARWGGEEFVILLPATDAYTTVKIAEKLRALIEQSSFETIEKLTCSFGVTEFNQEDSKEDFIKRADSALYTAKNNGRNRVELEI